MNLGELRAQARVSLDDQVEPYLWADTVLDGCINRGVTEGISRVYKSMEPIGVGIDYPAGFPEMPKPEGSFRIEEVLLHTIDVLGNNRHIRLPQVDLFSLDEIQPAWRGNTADKPTHFYQKDGILGLTPTPNVDTRVDVRARMMQAPPLVNDSDVPVIPTIYHSHLVLWVQYEALRFQDTDANNAGASRESLELFDKFFGPPIAPGSLRTIGNLAPNQTINRLRM